MDTTKPRPTLKLWITNGRESEATQREEGDQSTSGRDGGGEVEKPKATEKESDSEVEAAMPNPVTQKNLRAAVDRHRFNTVGYQKTQKQKVVNDFATVSKGVSGNVKSRAALRQVLFSQGVSDKAPTPEVEAVKRTLESFPVPALPNGKCEGRDHVSGAPLEDSWTEIVHSHSIMDKKQRHQQGALWELINTELTYIHKLTIVTDLVMASLEHLNQNGYLLEVTPQQLFSNLPSILHAHLRFWQDVMLPMLQEVRKTGAPLDPLKLEAGCLQFKQRFSPYMQYCWEEERILEFTRTLMDTNLQFQTYLTWVESHPQCARMRLGDMQAKPHTRITKYPLLLKAVLKNTQDPQAQYAVRRMLTSVSGFLDSINEYLSLKHKKLALSLYAQRVEGFELMEGISEEIDKHVREFCHFDLTSPIQGASTRDIRCLLLEETMRIRERKENKLEAVVLLFTDVVLLTKAVRKSEKLKLVRPPLALERMCCGGLKDGCSFVLVEVGELGCPVSLYTVTAPSPETRSDWIKAIHNAQESLAAMRERETAQRWREFSRADIQMERQFNPLSMDSALSKDGTELWNPLQVQHSLIPEIKLKEETSDNQSENEILPLREAEGGYNILSYLDIWNSPLLGRSSKLSNQRFSQSLHGQSLSAEKTLQNSRCGIRTAVVSGGEGKEDRDSSQLEWRESVFQPINERRVTWNRSKSPHKTSDLNKPLLPQVDYSESQPNVPSSLQEIQTTLSAPNTSLSTGRGSDQDTSVNEFESKEHILAIDSETQSSDAGSARDSWFIPSEEEDILLKGKRFSRKLKSPRLRRRRLIGSQHSSSAQMHRKGSLDSKTLFAPGTNSSSNSDSDCEQKRKSDQGPSPPTSHSQLVLDLRQLKKTHGVLWNAPVKPDPSHPQTLSVVERAVVKPDPSHPQTLSVVERAVVKPDPSHPQTLSVVERAVVKPDPSHPQTLSVVERAVVKPDPSHPQTLSAVEREAVQNSQKKTQFRAQRCASDTNIEIQGRSDSLVVPGIGLSSEPEVTPESHASSLEDILNRSRERERLQKGERRAAENLLFWVSSPSPSLSSSPSLSPSEEEQETEEEVFKLARGQTQGGAAEWHKEIDRGRNTERTNSISFPGGASVDWLGWCFDDSEVMVHLLPEGPCSSGVGTKGPSETQTLRDLEQSKGHDHEDYGEL